MKSWKLLPTFAVRATGFPAELLARLRFTQTTARAREIVACEAEINSLRRRLLEELFPQAVRQSHIDCLDALRPLFSSWRHAVGRQRPVHKQTTTLPINYLALQTSLEYWNSLLAKRQELMNEGRAAWQKELEERRLELRQIAQDPRIQEAIFLSNPDMYAALQRYLASEQQVGRNSAARKMERRFVFYLQRLCMKNETQSFFGPINYGQMADTARDNLQLRRAAVPLRQRKTFPAHWMVEALATAMSTDEGLQPFLCPRRSTFCQLQNEQKLYFPAVGKTLALEAEAIPLFCLANGHLTVREIADHLGEDWVITWKRGKQLEKLGALIIGIIVPGDLSEPLAYLHGWLNRLPADLPAVMRWKGVLEQIQGYIDAFSDADLAARVVLLAELETCFTSIWGDAARRGAGKMYSDRLLVFEECLGDLEQCTIGGNLAQAIAKGIQPILHLAWIYGQLQMQRDQRLARQHWQRLYTADAPDVPFLRYLQQLQHFQPSRSAEPDELDQFLQTLSRLVQSRSDGHRACLSSDDLPLSPGLTEADDCLYSSLDLMIAAPDLVALQNGAFQIILGEVHPYPLVWVFPTAYFLEQQGKDFADALQTALSSQSGGKVATQIAYTRRNKIYPYPLPGILMELRPRYPDCRAIAASEVTVREIEGKLRLWAKGHPLRLYTPLKRQKTEIEPVAPFAFAAMQPPPIDLGEHTPRIEIDQIVFQREKWIVPGGGFGDSQVTDFDLFLEVWRWKMHYQLPEEIFVRAVQEPKPFYVDMSNFFLLEVLDSIARQSLHLTITEMLPSMAQLWLERDTEHHACEFRAVVVADASGEKGGEE